MLCDRRVFKSLAKVCKSLHSLVYSKSVRLQYIKLLARKVPCVIKPGSLSKLFQNCYCGALEGDRIITKAGHRSCMRYEHGIPIGERVVYNIETNVRRSVIVYNNGSASNVFLPTGDDAYVKPEDVPDDVFDPLLNGGNHYELVMVPGVIVNRSNEIAACLNKYIRGQQTHQCYDMIANVAAIHTVTNGAHEFTEFFYEHFNEEELEPRRKKFAGREIVHSDELHNRPGGRCKMLYTTPAAKMNYYYHAATNIGEHASVMSGMATVRLRWNLQGQLTYLYENVIRLTREWTRDTGTAQQNEYLSQLFDHMTVEQFEDAFVLEVPDPIICGNDLFRSIRPY